MHGAQHLLGRAAQIGLDVEFGVFAQVGDAGAQPADLEGLFAIAKTGAGVGQAHPLALEHQVALHALQHGPGHAAGGQQAGRHIGHVHVLQMPGKAEFAVARLRHGQFVQVALDACLQVAYLAFAHAVSHIVAYLGGQGQGQVAVNLAGVGACDARLQVQLAPSAALERLPMALGLALQVGVGQLGFPLQLAQGLVLELPAQLGLQLLQGQGVFFQNAGPAQTAAIGHADVGLPALLGELRTQLRRPNACCDGGTRLRCVHALQVQCIHLDSALVLAHVFGGAFPVQLQLPHLPGHRVALQLGLPVLGQGQAQCHFTQGLQVQLFAVEFTLAALAQGAQGAARALAVLGRHIAAGPDQALVTHKGQLPRGQRPAIGVLLARHPPRNLRKTQWLQVGGQAHAHLGQVQVGGAARPVAPDDVGPQPQAAPARLQVGAQTHMLAQLRHVHLRKPGVGLAVPVLEAASMGGQQAALELAHQHKALAPFGRWRGVQAQHMLVQRVAQHQVHVGQGQGGGVLRVLPAAALVGALRRPAQGAAAHHHLVLAKQPVGGGVVCALAGSTQGQASHQPLAVGGVAHIQLGAVQHQLVQPQVEHRTDADGHHHARQAQGWAALSVQQGDVAQFERRHPTGGFGLQCADLHRHPYGAAGQLLERGTEIADSRHNPQMQGRPSCADAQADGQRQPGQQARQPHQPCKGFGKGGH